MADEHQVQLEQSSLGCAAHVQTFPFLCFPCFLSCFCTPYKQFNKFKLLSLNAGTGIFYFKETFYNGIMGTRQIYVQKVDRIEYEKYWLSCLIKISATKCNLSKFPWCWECGSLLPPEPVTGWCCLCWTGQVVTPLWGGFRVWVFLACFHRYFEFSHQEGKDNLLPFTAFNFKNFHTLA